MNILVVALPKWSGSTVRVAWPPVWLDRLREKILHTGHIFVSEYSFNELICLFYFFSQEISLTDESINVTLQTWNNINFRIAIYTIVNNYFNIF